MTHTNFAINGFILQRIIESTEDTSTNIICHRFHRPYIEMVPWTNSFSKKRRHKIVWEVD